VWSLRGDGDDAFPLGQVPLRSILLRTGIRHNCGDNREGAASRFKFDLLTGSVDAFVDPAKVDPRVVRFSENGLYYARCLTV
jgi:hypothetical protein